MATVRDMMPCRTCTQRGMGLIEVIFGIAMMSIVFWGLFGVFKLSLELVMSSKAKAGALALANEQIEFIRSLTYDAVGTVSGIPSGAIPQTELIELNQTTYTRRTFVQYVDAPEDGLGAADVNGITADYKVAKAELTWSIRGDERTFSLITNIVPKGIESLEGGGTIVVTVLDAYGAPLSGADVRVVNSTTDPAIDVTTFSNVDGLVMFPGAPEASNYEITVTKDGYSTAQTYGSTVANPNPAPAHLSVVESQTTNITLSIDELSSLAVYTYEPIREASFDDLFDDTSLLSDMASTTVSAGSVVLTSTAGSYESIGTASSVTIAPNYLYAWKELAWTGGEPSGTDLRVQLYFENASGVFELIPDTDLPNNSAGLVTSPIDLSGLSTSYDSLRIQGTLSTTDPLVTPSFDSWMLHYEEGPIPVPNIPFAVEGTKTIGSDADANPIYKFDESFTTDAAGQYTINNMEWDTYTLSINDAVVGWDIAESCYPQPTSVLPGVATTSTLYLVSDTAHSLLVAVVDSTGATLPEANVRLYRGASFDETVEGSSCGQAFFADVAASSLVGTYTLEVSRTGYQTATVSNVNIEGASQITVVLELN